MNNLVSIIMPVYNAEQFISEAINSVLVQTYPHWELLIINDGSIDGSLPIIMAFKDNRIQVFDQINQGVSAARNTGLNVMKGDFFCFLDSDDRLSKGSIRNRLKLFQERPEVTFVDGKIEIWNVDFSERIGERVQTFEGDPLNALCNIDPSCFFGPTWMIRRFANREYRFLESLSHGEDLFFYMEISLLNGYYAAVDETIYQYRSGNLSAMSNLDGLWLGYRTIYRAMKSQFNLTNRQLFTFKRKITSIMFKSFFAKLKLCRAIGVLFQYPKL
jgi:teichuronic acid biosynthesis glycosyltransferase TuaG